MAKGRLGGVIGWTVLALLAGGGYYFWTVRSAQTPAPAPNAANPAQAGGNGPQAVRSAEIVAADVPIVIKALGTVTPLTTLSVQTQVSGQLQHIQFHEGQMVKKGDFLIQIDDRPYQATLAQAQAQQAKDTALLNQAQADLLRYQTLIQQDSIARQQVEDQAFLVKQYQATVAADQAQIDAAKLNISYCHITSPIDGRVGLRQVDEGNYIQPSSSSALVVITQTDPISVIFAVPEDNIPAIVDQLNAGAELDVSIFDRTDTTQKAMGKLAAMDSQIDATTGTVKLRALLDNKDGHLFAQQFVNAHLLVKTLKQALVTPNAAIQQGVSGSFVYVVNPDNTVSVRSIKIGAVDGERTTVLQGLKLGDQVIIDGADRLKEGAKIMIRNGAGAGGKPSGTVPAAPPTATHDAAQAVSPASNADATKPAEAKTTAAPVAPSDGVAADDGTQPKKHRHKDTNVPAQ